MKYFLFLLSFFLTSLTADYTYIDYDKLVFSNCGGFEIVPSTDGSPMLQVLNLSGSDTEYISKAFYLDGRLLSVLPVTSDVYAQNDYMQMALGSSFDSGVPPTLNGTTFPSDFKFFVGEYLGPFMLMNEDTIAGYKMVTEGNYTSAPIYFQEEGGATYMGVTNQNLPVLSLYPSINATAYWGINTTAPVEMVTVSGDFKVENGILLLNEPFGVMVSDIANSGLYQFSGGKVTKLLNTLQFTLEGYASANVLFFGQTSCTEVGTGADISWMNTYMTLEYYDTTSLTWKDYDDPLYSSAIADIDTRSVRTTDADDDLRAHHLTPFFATKLDIDASHNNDTSTLYRVNLYVTAGATLGSSDYLTDEANIYVLGLPTGNYDSVSQYSAVDSSQTIESGDQASLIDIEGNFFTNNLISFGSGGAIIESGHNLIFADNANYLDFKSSTVGFGEFHRIDSLKISNDTNTYPFQVGDTSGLSLGFAPYGSFYSGPLATQNIQTLNNEAATDQPLYINSDVYFGESIAIKTNGIVSPNFEIGNVISDSTVALNIEDNLLFTGDYTGDLVDVKYKYVDPEHYKGLDFRNNWIDLSSDTITLTLDDSANWNIMMFGYISMKLGDRPNKNSMKIKAVGPSHTYYSEPMSLYVETDSIGWGTLYNVYNLQGVPGGTYTISLYVKGGLYSLGQTSGDYITTIYYDPNNNGFRGVSENVSLYGGAISVVAIPSN